jgi:DNA-binding MarR family transcriptional regulator
MLISHVHGKVGAASVAWRRSLTLRAAWQLLLLRTTDRVNSNQGRAVTGRQLPGPSAQAGESPLVGRRKRTRRRRDAIELGALEDHLGYFVRRLQVWIFQDFVRALAAVDIRPAQYSVLVVIEANPGLSQADLAETLGIERARLVRLLDGLERRGFTRRQASPVDRRSHALSLTATGQDALKRIKSLAARHEANLAERLGVARRGALLDALRDFG